MKTYFKNKNILVTGASGFLGGYLTEGLLRQGANVTALLRDRTPRARFWSEGFDARVQVVYGALEDYALLERALGEYEVDTVFHLGAQAIVGVANRNPLSTFETNIKGTWNVLEAARRSPRIRKVIVASSDKAYGDHAVLPYTEDAPLQGRHPYDVSKSAADLIAQSYFATYRLPVTIVRCGNLFGGGDLNFSRIIPGTIASICDGERPIIRSDGTLIRDYFYVEDAVEAYLLLAEKMDDAALHGHAFNFGSGEHLSVLEVVERIRTSMHSRLSPLIRNEATSEIQKQYLSTTKAKELLGWSPRYTVTSGITKTIPWYRTYVRSRASKR